MNPARSKLLRTATILGAVVGVGTHLVRLLQGRGPDYVFSLGLLASCLVAGAFGLVFSDPRQIDWYRRSMLLPWASVWIAVLIAAALHVSGPVFAWIYVGWMLVLAAAPVAWLAGALWIRWHPTRPRAC